MKIYSFSGNGTSSSRNANYSTDITRLVNGEKFCLRLIANDIKGLFFALHPRMSAVFMTKLCIRDQPAWMGSRVLPRPFILLIWPPHPVCGVLL